MKTITLLTDMEQNCLFIKPEKYEEAINALRERGFDIMDLANGIKNTETAPKYAPNRLFRKGDKVRVVKWNGRDIARVGQIGYVVSNEYNSRVELSIDGWKNSVYYPACHLELVTPVEERERYIIIHNENNKYYEVCWKDDDEPDGRTGRTRCRATFWYNQPPQTYTQKEAKEAAEAERDRLNAEYRKEKNND